MHHNRRMLRLFLPMALLAGTAPAHADNCAAIRSAIETKIRSNGITNPVLTVVAQDAQAPGRVVGSCDRGAKKIVYTVGTAAPAAGTTTSPSAGRVAAPVITECADGRVITSGSCKK
jgi:Protein of unknown function (DUF1161)